MKIKPVTFHGDTLVRIRDFPQDARSDAGHELYQVQRGLEPSDGNQFQPSASGSAKSGSAMPSGRTA
jgi:phage-related protein